MTKSGLSYVSGIAAGDSRKGGASLNRTCNQHRRQQMAGRIGTKDWKISPPLPRGSSSSINPSGRRDVSVARKGIEELLCQPYLWFVPSTDRLRGRTFSEHFSQGVSGEIFYVGLMGSALTDLTESP